MLTFEQMLIRFAIALILGAILGIERELVHKEAGVRTLMLVTAGAAIFTMIGLALPYIVSAQTGNLADVVARNSGFLTIIANIVVGIGFLGGGLIIKMNDHAHGVTTAALVWTAAALGILIGVGLIEFGITATVILAILLYLLRKMNISESIDDFEKRTGGGKK
jgi:putative Mg2+ transporter-C (MgtC) family protein